LLFTPFAKVRTIMTIESFHLGMLLFCGLNTLIAYGAFAESLEHWEASRVSAVIALAPIVTLITVNIISITAPSLIPPERFTFTAILGAVLLVIGSMAIAVGKTE
jgi:drug/metabolite transporter (DMT)-like permease